MNTQTQEALHKALKVLNCLNNDRVYETAWVKGAINACEKALAQPQPKLFLDLSNSNGNHPVEPAQEPVALEAIRKIMVKHGYQNRDMADEIIEAIAHPAPSWQGLSDEEIEAVTGEDIRSLYSGTYEAYRAIEQALKEKNHG